MCTCGRRAATRLGRFIVWTQLTLVCFCIQAIFAFLRPRVRSLYAIREWFCSPGLRPPELSNGFFAFLNPPVPLVPSLPSASDIDDAREARINPQPGQANPDPAQLFASDEQLAQRTLWVVFLICLGLSFLALAVALPIYLVNTPCLPASGLQVEYGGRYGTLNDLSLMRLLRMMDEGSINTSSKLTSIWKRLVVNGKDLSDNAYARLIAICCIVIFLAIIPILWKLWKEFTALAEYHKAWDQDRCESFEMGYLSCGTSDHILLGNRGGAWGWRGWGEGKVKSFLRKAGLGGGSNITAGGRKVTTAGTGGGEKSALLSTREAESRRRNQPSPGSSEERADAEINVTSVFSVG
jgi:calcium permeable stress-gated cation channel